MTHPATDLRISLEVAARSTQQFGATQPQIDLIVALARGANQFDILSGGHLTKGEASRIIDTMTAAGAEANYDKSDAELDDEDRLAEEVAESVAHRKASKTQKKAAKAGREALKNEAARQIEGRRVSHLKFGEGTVIAEDDKAVTVMFDNEPSPKRMVPAVLAEA